MPVLRRVWLWMAVCLLFAVVATGCASQQFPGGEIVPQPADHEPQATVTTAAATTPVEEPETPAEEPETLTEEPETPTEEPTMPTEELAAPTEAPATPTEAPATPTSELKSTTTTGGGSQANADVLFVVARQETENSWHFSVTVEHPDTGWEDYADGWDVVLPDGTVAKPDPDSPFTRLLLHPHETEQPFTRSQSGVVIEPGITEVTVRAHDLVDGFGGREVVVDLSQESGADFEVQRR